MTTDQRLARLERQNAWMKATVAGMAVVLAAVFLVAAGQDRDKPEVLEEVRARRLILLDRESRQFLRIEKSGKVARLTMRGGEEGSAAVTVVAASIDKELGYSGIWLSASGKPWGKEDEEKIKDRIFENEGGKAVQKPLSLHEGLRIANMRVGLQVESSGSSSIAVRDAAGFGRVQIGVTPALDASIRIADGLGCARAILGSAKLEKRGERSASKRDESSLLLLEQDGSICFKAPE
jgi:hypothetical protein